MTIALYDIPSSLPSLAWAPNPFKAKFALDYKGIPYQTVWVDFHTMEKTLKAIGAPLSVSASGNPAYLTPVIVNSETGQTVSNSMTVAEYLDEVYPDKPTLFPPGTAAAISAFESIWQREFIDTVIPLMAYVVYTKITPESQPFFRSGRELKFGCKLEEILPVEKRSEQWEKLKAALSKVAALLDKNGKNTPFFLGDTFSYADCIIGGYMMWLKMMMDPQEWEKVAGFDGGRWAKAVGHCEQLRDTVSSNY